MIPPARRLGQHFLKSAAVLRNIIAAADLTPDDTVLEIGAGTGALTRALAARVCAVIAVEKDHELCRSLEVGLQREGVLNIRLVRGDILKIPFDGLGLPERYLVVANIPYYLTGRLIRKLLEADPPPEKILLMVQREVAERITAKPPRMNLLAVAVQACANVEILFAVPRSAFRPMPEVDSAFIRIAGINRKFFEQHGTTEETFFRIVRAAFRGQRKTIENALAVQSDISKKEALAAARRLGLAGRRPGELTLDQWMGLVRMLVP